jgi:hypothetical protein
MSRRHNVFCEFNARRRQLSSQLVQWDAALQTLLRVTGVLFTLWFVIQLNNILIWDLILVALLTHVTTPQCVL